MTAVHEEDDVVPLEGLRRDKTTLAVIQVDLAPPAPDDEVEESMAEAVSELTVAEP